MPLKTVAVFCLSSAAAVAQLPDTRLTPGAVTNATREQVCTPGWASAHRNVSIAIKKFVYREYRMPYRPKEAEVDHLISLQLGGDNSIRNLWPESYTGEWNAHVKDFLETRAHRLVCVGAMPLGEAQQRIATDWISFYKDVFHTDRPLERHRRTQ